MVWDYSRPLTPDPGRVHQQFTPQEIREYDAKRAHQIESAKKAKRYHDAMRAGCVGPEYARKRASALAKGHATKAARKKGISLAPVKFLEGEPSK